MSRKEDENIATEKSITGTVIFFNNPNGYGFIKADNQTGDHFVHFTESNKYCKNPPLSKGDRVKFDGIETSKGNEAINLRKEDANEMETPEEKEAINPRKEDANVKRPIPINYHA